jgi:hypothetical protein
MKTPLETRGSRANDGRSARLGKKQPDGTHAHRIAYVPHIRRAPRGVRYGRVRPPAGGRPAAAHNRQRTASRAEIQLDPSPVLKLATEMAALALTDAGLREAAGSSRTGLIIASSLPGLSGLVSGQLGLAASGPYRWPRRRPRCTRWRPRPPHCRPARSTSRSPAGRSSARRAGLLKVGVEVLGSAAAMHSPGMARCAALPGATAPPGLTGLAGSKRLSRRLTRWPWRGPSPRCSPSRRSPTWRPTWARPGLPGPAARWPAGPCRGCGRRNRWLPRVRLVSRAAASWPAG